MRDKGCDIEAFRISFLLLLCPPPLPPSSLEKTCEMSRWFLNKKLRDRVKESFSRLGLDYCSPRTQKSLASLRRRKVLNILLANTLYTRSCSYIYIYSASSCDSVSIAKESFLVLRFECTGPDWRIRKNQHGWIVDGRNSDGCTPK